MKVRDGREWREEGGGRWEVGCEQSLQETNRNILCWPSRLATLLTPRHCKLLIGGQLIIDTVKLVKCKDRLQAAGMLQSVSWQNFTC